MNCEKKVLKLFYTFLRLWPTSEYPEWSSFSYCTFILFPEQLIVVIEQIMKKPMAKQISNLFAKL